MKGTVLDKIRMCLVVAENPGVHSQMNLLSRARKKSFQNKKTGKEVKIARRTPIPLTSLLIQSPFKIAGTVSYGASIASDGHTSTQAPQSVQVSGSMIYFGSPSLIASTGHSLAQAPHIIQLSLIL
jgi:hypothetical protein